MSYVFTRFLPVVRAMLYTMSYTTSYVFWTTSYVQRTISPKNVRCRTFLPVSCQSYVRCCIRCRIRHRMFFGRHRTYNVRYRQKTYDVVRFYPFLAILTYDIVYDIVRFLTMSHTMCKTTSVLYDLVRQVPMSLAHIAINIRYMATTSYAISQHTICHT
jgi:hypothetical protein